MGFITWRDKCNKHFNDNEVPEDLFAPTDHIVLCKWLSFFVVEVRKKDGTE